MSLPDSVTASEADHPRGQSLPGWPASEPMFQAMADALPVCISHVGADQRFRFVNATYERWFGLSRQDIVGRKVSDILGEEAYAETRPKIEAALRGEPQNFDYRAEYQHGGPREVQVTYIPVADAEGRFGFFALIHDVTERVSGERRVQGLLECFRAVTLAAFEGIAILEDGRYIDVNERYARRLGYAPDELIGKSYADLVSPESMSRVDAAVASEFQGVYEIMARQRDGTPFPAEICAANIDLDGRRLRITAARDLSSRYAIEKAVADVSHREQIRIGHDLHDSLGQELAGLALGLEGLRQKLKGSKPDEADELAQLMQVLKRAIRNARAMAHGLAPVLDGDRGLSAALEQLAEDASRLHHIDVRRQFVDCPGLDTTRATNVYRVAQEAISNAVRHSGARSIEIRAEAADGQFVLAITDDGLGFQQDAAVSGGMGMQTMRHRARLLSGQCVIGPGPGPAGTRVRLSFPLLD